MKTKITFAYVIILVTFIPGLSIGQNSANNSTFIKLGASQVNITPEQPVMMSGYDARKTPSTGIHDSLFASALFFSGEQNKVLIITADLIGFSNVFIDSMKEMIFKKTGLSRDKIMMVATHNHGGPALRTYEDKLPQANDDYITSLKEKLVVLATDAMRSPVPFYMAIGKGTCKLNINRRALFADGGVWLGRNPDGPCDHEVDVIKFTDAKNNLIAVLVNWPCHGTVSGQDNYQVTGDWPASAARHIKKQVGKDVVVAVTAGASADINPIYGPGSDFDEIEAVGYHVANEVSKTLSTIKTSPAKSLNCINSGLTSPGKKSWKDRFPQPSYTTGSDVEIRFTAMKIGEIVLCGISGEVMTEMGMKVKKESPYPATVIITHCNGSSGYICTDKAFTEGGYEVQVSQFMPGVEKPLVRKCLDMIHSF